MIASVIGSPRVRVDLATQPYRGFADDHAKPPARYSAMESARSGDFATAQLHHPSGHDRPRADCERFVPWFDFGNMWQYSPEGLLNLLSASPQACVDA